MRNTPTYLLRLAIPAALAGAGSAHAGATESSWWRVHAGPDAAAAAHFRGGEDYSHFRWLALPADDAAALRAAGIEVHAADDAFELALGGVRFDPLRDGAPPPGIRRSWSPQPGDDWRLVQFTGPLRSAWLKGLAEAGMEPVQYIHPYTYVVWADAESSRRAAQLEGVRWVGEFLPDYRYAPPFRGRAAGPVTVELLARPGLPSIDDALSARNVEVISRGHMDRHFEVIEIIVDAGELEDIATLPGIYSVQPVAVPQNRSEMSVQINSGNVDGSGAAFPGYRDYLDDIGVDGSGVILACVDSGTQADHPDLVNRMLPCNGAPSCGTGAQSGAHGTHVAGIMVADGSSGTLNTGGFLRGLGMAPGARLVEQRYTNAITAPQYLNRMRDSVRNNAVLSNNSWGGGGPAGYESTARQVDIGSRDADADAPGDQPLLYVLAIDNGYGGTSSQGVPDEAKNIFTIGSAWAQVSAETQDLRNNDISENSAHGPALDGRFIPFMIANSRYTESSAGTSGYAMQGGTSQAAPHVAGASGLFFQYYRKLYGSDPSPAMVKASFLAITRDLTGNNDADGNVIAPRPASTQGWGRMQPHKVLAPDHPVVHIDQTHVFAESGETWQVRLAAADPDAPMQVMLVWTDAPGPGLGGATPGWVNDLDLRVTAADDSLYLGNVFNAGWSATGGTPDTRNNSEGAFLRADQHQGHIDIEVLAANIAGNALPNAGADNAQDFALACYNCVMPAAGADLALVLTDVPDPVTAGTALTWVIGVSNMGPGAATNTRVQLALPPEAVYSTRYVDPGPSGLDWSCAASGSDVECQLDGDLPAGVIAPLLSVEAMIAVTAEGPIEATATASSDTPDPYGGNNSRSETTEVLPSGDILFRDGFECAAGRPGC
ncbi:S8 family serine peptidase [Pseudofulvimonas gallinarii]|uniref:Subtilase family protein n=1 Tax=Pseudofulvimonas gallinarii TaxID=634155 RepID=A0A4R3LHG7_9GAMM|nr:S8 family serine peptidase [Pseudofulvimonas gallinarii]TCS99613.1 subtilase family protein [Pseudofulvimonas gallinarii]